MKVSVSYSRKLNHELYGGNSFENSDYFASVEIDVSDDSDVSDLYKGLQETVKDAVNKAIDEQIFEFQGGIPVQEFKSFMYDYIADRPVQGEVYERMSRYQQDIIQVMKRGKATRKRDELKHETK